MSDGIGDDEAANRSTRRQSPFSFEMVEIPSGSELIYYDNETVTATVHSRNRIVFEGYVTSLSVAALTLLHREALNWVTANGPSDWLYDGETLPASRRSPRTAAARPGRPNQDVRATRRRPPGRGCDAFARSG